MYKNTYQRAECKMVLLPRERRLRLVSARSLRTATHVQDPRDGQLGPPRQPNVKTT